MPRWKENHYARAAEFTRLLGAALGRSAAAPDAPAPAAAPALTPSPAKPAGTPGATAASVFTNIPWKK